MCLECYQLIKGYFYTIFVLVRHQDKFEQDLMVRKEDYYLWIKIVKNFFI